MRFKSKMATEQVAALSHVVTPMSRLQDPQKGAVVYMDPDFVRISCKSEAGITCFAELSNPSLFLEHRIESAAENVILCQVDLLSVKLALQSVLPSQSSSRGRGNHGNHQHSSYSHTQGTPTNNSLQSLFMGQQQTVIFKLAKRQGFPCLCLEGKANQAGAVEIHQAIPVRILRANEMQYHLPPQINMPQVQLELPLQRPIRGIVDKLKAMGPHIFLEASMKGDLTIRMDHDGASLAFYYNNLQTRMDEPDSSQQPSQEGASQPQQRPNPDSSCILKVDASKLAQCLQWQQNHTRVTSCLLGMVQNEMLVLHILLHPEQMGFFTYYLPVHYLSEDELLQ